MIGTQIGPYAITAKLGEGGMGEVWRATDTRLRREVAIKVLPTAFVADAERLARFEREAQLLAQLQHPNIASIYGLEDSTPLGGGQAGTRALVMELVEGEELSARIARAPVPVDEAIAIARQIAEALEAAHEKGIVHRDLKPANIKLAPGGTVKVLDFGLAKAVDAATGSTPSAADLARSPTLMHSPTVTSAAIAGGTQLGVILGTAAYMSPEQARGGVVDKRADIWAFGVVLFEMLTGRSLFAGESISDTLAGVLKSDVDFARLPAGTPPELRRVLRRCLERNPRTRLHDIADARIAIDEMLAGDRDDEVTAPASQARGWRRWLPWSVAALAVAAGVAAATFGRAAAAPVIADRPVQRTSILMPSSGSAVQVPGTFALAPDGRAIAFVAADASGRSRLFVRELADPEPRALDGTEGPSFPFWSADSRHVGFFADGQLRRVPRSGGATQTICAARNGRGGAWSPNGTIVFADDWYGPLQRVSASGGQPAPATVLDTATHERSHRHPAFLPDGRHFFFGVEPWEEGFRMRIKVASLDEVSSGRQLVSASAVPRFAAPNELVMPRDEALVAQALDLERLEVLGEPRLLDERPLLDGDITSTPVVHVSDDGKMLYAPADTRPTAFVWLDRSGAQIGETRSQQGSFMSAAISRRGDRVAAVRVDPGLRRSLWVFDLERGDGTRLTSPELVPFGAVWSPDDREIATQLADGAASSRNAPSVVEVESGRIRRLFQPTDDRWVAPWDWSPDGRLLVFAELVTGSRNDLGFVELDGEVKRTSYLATPAHEDGARLSPDGRWLAYLSDASGKNEVYLDSFPVPSRARRVAVDGEPRQVDFRADGRELFIVAVEGAQSGVYACDLVPGDEIGIGSPRRLFSLPGDVLPFAPAPKGDRFLLLKPVGNRPPVLTLVDPWRAQTGGAP